MPCLSINASMSVRNLSMHQSSKKLPTSSIGNYRLCENTFPYDISDMRTDDIDALIKANIESLLVERDLKPTRLSLDAQLSRTTIGDILAGRTRSPSYSTLCKIAGAAGVNVLRITVGPSWEDRTREEQQILDLSARLPEDLRRKLLGYGQGLLDASE